MPYYSRYHIREHSARALLDPLRAALQELEHRAQHYAGRITMQDADREVIAAAHKALAAAREEVERLWRDAGRTTHG
jgi:hypothetical protein